MRSGPGSRSRWPPGRSGQDSAARSPIRVNAEYAGQRCAALIVGAGNIAARTDRIGPAGLHDAGLAHRCRTLRRSASVQVATTPRWLKEQSASSSCPGCVCCGVRGRYAYVVAVGPTDDLPVAVIHGNAVLAYIVELEIRKGSVPLGIVKLRRGVVHVGHGRVESEH